MKALILLAIVLVGLPVLAKKPQEKPYAVSSLLEIDPEGTVVPTSKIHRLVLLKRGEVPSSFIWETTGSEVATRRYVVTSVTQDRCGSTVYSAKEMRSKQKFTLLDHSSRLCDDRRLGRWEVHHDWEHVLRMYIGTPTVISSCDSLPNVACIMLYAPVKCGAGTLGGETLDPPLEVQGANECFAVQAVKKAACERGLDPNLLRDDELFCSLVSPE